MLSALPCVPTHPKAATSTSTFSASRDTGEINAKVICTWSLVCSQVWGLGTLSLYVEVHMKTICMEGLGFGVRGLGTL